MSKKKTAPKASMPTGKYDLDRVLGGRGSTGGGGGELDRFLREEEKRQIDAIKGSRAKVIELQYKKQVQDLEKDLAKGSPAGGGSLLPTPKDLAFLDSLPPEKRPMALQAMAAFRNQAGAEGGLGSLLAVAMLQGNRQEPMTIDKMVVGMKGMQEMIMTGQQKGDTSMTMELVKLVSLAQQTAFQSQIDMLNRQMEERSPYNPLEYHKGLIETAKGMGMKVEGVGATPEIEMRRLEYEKDRDDKRLEWDMQKEQWLRQDNRTNMLIENFFRSPMAQQFVMGKLQPQQQKQPPLQPDSNVALICPHCNFQPVWVPAANPVGTCPSCGKGVMQAGYQPTGAQPPGGSQRPPPPGGYGSGSPPTGPPG